MWITETETWTRRGRGKKISAEKVHKKKQCSCRRAACRRAFNRE
ncbi:hypothetical protein HID58_081641 [Brassica napus]|uniref:Uncharacterized protein n=1 Tax=Brassica napus TaxID=3708 RepID=A0ABQ7Y8C0_BRANA|nr:hypothetical protein HID58_081641 [Brassica napus]